MTTAKEKLMAMFWNGAFMELNGGADEVEEIMIEFAMSHLKAQRDAIIKILEARGTHNNIDFNIINNAYPLSNVK